MAAMKKLFILMIFGIIFWHFGTKAKRTDRKSEPKGGRQRRVHVNKYANKANRRDGKEEQERNKKLAKQAKKNRAKELKQEKAKKQLLETKKDVAKPEAVRTSKYAAKKNIIEKTDIEKTKIVKQQEAIDTKEEEYEDDYEDEEEEEHDKKAQKDLRDKQDDKKHVEESDEEEGSEEDDEDEEPDEEIEDGDVDEEDKEEDEDDDDGEDDTEPDTEPEDEFFGSEEFKGELREQIKEKGIFYNKDSIKQFFTGEDFYKDEDVENLLRRFNNSEAQVREKIEANAGKPLMPFYVVEGSDPATRTKVAQILAHRVKGMYLMNQPRINLGPVQKDGTAKRAYYSLSKYITANKVMMALHNKPVVTERYWMDHASYIMAKVWDKAANLPKAGAEVYKFPEDLIVPNITFVILNTPPPRLGKPPSASYKFEQRMMVVYKRFTGAKVYIIRFPESAKLIAEKIEMYLNGQLYSSPNKHFSITVLD